MYKFKIINLTLTDDEVRAENRAIQKANEFMETYGKGQKPYGIDMRFYESGISVIQRQLDKASKEQTRKRKKKNAKL